MRAWLAGEVGDQPLRHRWGEQGVAGGHHPDRVDELGGGGVFEQEAAGAGRYFDNGCASVRGFPSIAGISL